MQHRCTTTVKKILCTALVSTVAPTEGVVTVQVGPVGLGMRHVEGGKRLRNTTAFIAVAKSASLGSVGKNATSRWALGNTHRGQTHKWRRAPFSPWWF